MKGFLVCILFFAAAGAASRHWTSEAVSAQRIAQQQQGGVRPAGPYTCPASHPIKGNFTASTGERCIFHLPGGELYSQTKPEMCYAMPADAVADGCGPPRR
jgi:hypothetical protein